MERKKRILRITLLLPITVLFIFVAVVSRSSKVIYCTDYKDISYDFPNIVVSDTDLDEYVGNVLEGIL